MLPMSSRTAEISDHYGIIRRLINQGQSCTFLGPGPSKAHRIVHTSRVLYPNADSAKNSCPSREYEANIN